MDWAYEIRFISYKKAKYQVWQSEGAFYGLEPYYVKDVE